MAGKDAKYVGQFTPLSTRILNHNQELNGEMDEISLGKKEIATAIFEYLLKRGKVPNRKKGVRFDNNWGSLTCWVEIKDESKKLGCGHPLECQYFHPALRGGARYRCIACDDPKGNSRAMKELKEKGII